MRFTHARFSGFKSHRADSRHRVNMSVSLRMQVVDGYTMVLDGTITMSCIC